MPNFSFQDPDIPSGSTIDSGNFTQFLPDTEIMVGKTFIINGGNFTNVKEQPGWDIVDGNWTKKSFCSHLHVDWVPLGLGSCVIECSHMISKDEIVMDGVLIDTIYKYEDTVL